MLLYLQYLPEKYKIKILSWIMYNKISNLFLINVKDLNSGISDELQSNQSSLWYDHYLAIFLLQIIEIIIFYHMIFMIFSVLYTVITAL